MNSIPSSDAHLYILQAIERSIAFPPLFKKVAKSAVAAIFLSQAWYWTQRLPEEREGWFYKTQKQWEEETGLTRYEQETARKHLIKLGLMCESRRGNPAKLWFCVNQKALASKCAEILQSRVQQHHNLDCSDAAIKNGEPPQSLITKSTAETTTENTHTPEELTDGQSPTTANDDATVARFQRWYAVYPKKKAKADAERAWKKLNPDDAFTDELIAHVEAWKQTEDWRKNGGQYIPLPATWLNGRRWEDELPARQSQEKSWRLNANGVMVEAWA